MATVQAITLKFVSPWTKPGRDTQEWSVKFHLSGEAISNQADAETAALGLADPILSLVDSNTYLGSWLHYPAGSDINDFQAVYGSGDHPGTFAGYASEPADWSQLEVCALLRAPIGPNSKGRMKYLFKYVHGPAQAGNNPPDTSNLRPLADPLPFATYNTGIDASNRIPVAPDGTVPVADWAAHTYLVTRQLRRGQPAKA